MTICGDPRGPLSYIIVNDTHLVSLKIGGDLLLDVGTCVRSEDWRERLGEFALEEGFTRLWYEGAPKNYQHTDLITYMRNEGILPSGRA